ncbi:MAG: hypothetical protein QM484_07795 [Woeseiaceae bacterium]
MLWKPTNLKSNMPVSKLFLSTLFILQASCGGGESNSEASAIGIQDVPIAFIKRPTPRDQNNDLISNDMREPTAFTEGGDLYLQARASSTAGTINVTGRITKGLGDVKDVSASFDGAKLVFSLRLEDLTNGNNPPKWYLYEYVIASDTLTQLTSAGAADGDDVSPHYLPEDGRIIFASTRKPLSKGILGNEGRQQIFATDENRRNTAFALHIREKNGDIIQVSFNQSHDLDPIVLAESGRILFSRWNHMGSRNDISLYSMNPDGSDLQLYYGAHSHRTGQDPNTDIHFSKPQEMQDGRILAILRPLVTNFGGGDITFINGKDFADNTQPIWSQQAVVTGTAQTTFKQNVNNASGLSLKGRYNAIFPLLDGSNRYLMSWSQCQILIDPLIAFDPADPAANIVPCTLATQAQLTDPAVVEAPPSFGIFLVDESSDTQVPLILPEADRLFSEVVMAYTVKIPPVIFDKVPGVTVGVNETFSKEGVGVLHIRSVYDFDGVFGDFANNISYSSSFTPKQMADPKNITADQRPARFIRITKGVSLPDRDTKRIDNTAFGRSTQQGMREIVGYAPIEPDGSVKIKVPANVPLTIGILDKDGRRISNRHQSWFQVKAGETLECVGCHVHNTADQASNKPHGRPDYTSKFNAGAETTGLGFPNSVIALFGQIEETMAEARARHSCLSTPPCADMKPSTDLVYSDVWTDDVAANRSADASFTIDYTGVPVSPLAAPVTSTSSACANNYSDPITTASFVNCRIVLNYQAHIQPIWVTTANRPAAAECTSCHTATGFAHLNAGQLELTSGPSTDEPDHLISYRELLFNDQEQEDNAGTLQDIMITRDILVNGLPIDLNNDNINDQETVPDPARVTVATMSTAGARSSEFMELMTGLDLNGNGSQPTDTKAHNTMLTASELKLLSEWLDIGAQYFNNPFDTAVPIN